MKRKRDYTKGSILKAILYLSIPIVFAEVLQLAYILTDTFWVGRLGKEAVAAVSASFPVIFFLTSIGSGFAIAGTILVAQYWGSKNKKKANYVSSQTVMITFFVSMILMIFGVLMAEPVMGLMGVEEVVLQQAVSYMRIIFLGVPLLFQYFVFQSLLRGVGDVKTPLYIVFGTVILNLVLDPLFMFGYGPIPAYGVTGTAIATLGTQGIAGLIGIFILCCGKKNIKIERKHFVFDKAFLKKIFYLGAPTSIENGIRSFGLVTLTFIAAMFGTEMVAAWGIGGRILNFVIIPCFGLAIATSALVGQNMGAKKIHRAEKTGFMSSLIGFIVLTVFGIMMFFGAESISSFFVPGEKDVIYWSSSFIRLMAFTFGFIALRMVAGGVFKGSGNTKTSLFTAMLYMWILLIPLAYLLPFTSLGQIGMWVAFPIANVLSASVAFLIMIKGDWKNKKIIE